MPRLRFDQTQAAQIQCQVTGLGTKAPSGMCAHTVSVEANEQGTEVICFVYIEYFYGLAGSGGLCLNPSQALEYKGRDFAHLAEV